MKPNVRKKQVIIKRAQMNKRNTKSVLRARAVCDLEAVFVLRKKVHKTTIKINGLAMENQLCKLISFFSACALLVHVHCALVAGMNFFLFARFVAVHLVLHVYVFVRKCLGIYRNETLLLR